MTLISSAKEHGIEFIYAISPGLDITFSNQKEVSTLKRKLDQVKQFYYFFIIIKYIFFSYSKISPLSLILNCLYRFLILGASPLLYFLMTSITTCVQLTKKYLARLHMHKFQLPMRSTST